MENSDRRGWGRSWARVLGGLSIGALGALGLRWTDVATSGPGPVHCWVADRNGQRVVGLDADLFEAASAALDWPVAAEGRGDGGVWVASAAGGEPLGEHRLVRLDGGAKPQGSLTFGPLLDLAGVDGGDALVVEWPAPPKEPRRLWRVPAEGPARLLLELPDLVSAAGRGELVLAGTQTGELLLSRGGVGIASRRLTGGYLNDLAPGPDGGWWVLDIDQGGRLLLLDAQLEPRWQVELGFSPLHLAAREDRERVWLADTTQPCARRYGPGGALELELADLPLSGLDQALATARGGVLLAAPGAVLAFDSYGTTLPGQGGFQFLVDISPVPR